MGYFIIFVLAWSLCGAATLAICVHMDNMEEVTLNDLLIVLTGPIGLMYGLVVVFKDAGDIVIWKKRKQ